MKRSIIIIAVLTLFIILTNITFASDVDDAKAVVQNLYDALNTNDAQEVAKCVLPERNSLPDNRGLLTQLRDLTTSQDVQNRMQFLFDAGLKHDLTIHHLDARVYGNSAVITFYKSGPKVLLSGDVQQGIFRGKAVCIKEAGKWKIVHTHLSRLQTEQ